MSCNSDYSYSNNCQECYACFNNCSSCPAGRCQKRTMYLDNLKRINRQVRTSSSLGLLRKKVLNVSRQVGQSAHPKYLSQAGGPGDLISAVQKTNSCSFKSNCKGTTYRVPIAQRRTAYKGDSGVDRKHGSYARYLARRTGGVLRKESLPIVRNRLAYIHQPRNRTGTAAGCTTGVGCKSKNNFTGPTKFLGRARTAFKCNDSNSQSQFTVNSKEFYPDWTEPRQYYDNVMGTWRKNNHEGLRPLFGPTQTLEADASDCCDTKCCDNRIPGGKSMGKYEFKCDASGKYNCARNVNSENVSGLLGNNTQGVPSSRCSCCPKFKSTN